MHIVAARGVVLVSLCGQTKLAPASVAKLREEQNLLLPQQKTNFTHFISSIHKIFGFSTEKNGLYGKKRLLRIKSRLIKNFPFCIQKNWKSTYKKYAVSTSTPKKKRVSTKNSQNLQRFLFARHNSQSSLDVLFNVSWT